VVSKSRSPMSLADPAIGCSVVIPTWNEQAWLPRLLASLHSHPDVREIIVADNSSTDMTVSIAASSGCSVVRGGRPARARNAGAGIAQSDVIMFVDADAVVPPEATSRALQLLLTADVSVVHFPLVPLSQNVLVKACYKIMDWYLYLLHRISVPQGMGSYLAVRRSDFWRIGGFREELAAAEDVDFVRRAARHGVVCYDRTCSVYVSARRLRLENPAWYIVKAMVWALLRLTRTRASLFPYRWETYPESFALEENAQLQRSDVPIRALREKECKHV